MMIETIFLAVYLLIGLCINISVLVTSIQSFIYNRKREKREAAREERDKEYYTRCIGKLMNK